LGFDVSLVFDVWCLGFLDSLSAFRQFFRMYKIRGADDKEYGPVTIEQLRQWIVEGRANAHTYIQGPDSTEWKPLSSYPELAALVPAPLPQAATPGIQGAPGTQPEIPTYLVPSILCTLCCCLPLGVVAIVFAAQVSSKLAAGDIPGAIHASKQAKLWCWISFGVGLVGGAVLSLLQVAGFLAGFHH
jgi:hypothetical protein